MDWYQDGRWLERQPASGRHDIHGARRPDVHVLRADRRLDLPPTALSRRPEKKSEPAAPAERRVLPMDLQVGDRLADESGEWEVIGRPYTTGGGKTARVRVQRVSAPAVTELRTWGAHERISVKRA